MKVGILTSSRADFGIYIPLLTKLQKENFVDLEIIAFGTHLSENHGKTISEIESFNLGKIHEVETLPAADSPSAIAESIGETIVAFSNFWNENTFDLVISLGDRYEMFAAVSASSPFNIRIAHIHAGETTLGAIDNAYRHAISLFSKYLFVTTEKYKQRALEIVEKDTKVFNVGALSIDNLEKIDFLSKEAFKEKFKIDLSKPTILSTFHPETVAFEGNKNYIKELINSFTELKNHYQILITLPNTDTMGQMIREELLQFGKRFTEVKIVESLGMLGYLSCMKHCAFMLGNTSSGFVEASYFPKFVINLGDRQKGRILSQNIINTEINKDAILAAVKRIEESTELSNEFIYGRGDASNKIVEILKRIDE